MKWDRVVKFFVLYGFCFIGVEVVFNYDANIYIYETMVLALLCANYLKKG